MAKFFYGHVPRGDMPSNSEIVEMNGYIGVVLNDIYTVYTPELQKQYPYAAIVYLSLWSKVLILNSTPFVIVDKVIAEDLPKYKAINSSSSWQEYDSSLNYGAETLLWANHDILNSNGSVYLAASDPVPVVTNTLDPTALLMGWLVGKRVAGLRKTQTDVPVVPDEPIAYLYNGVRLPDINEVWDKTAYPYAVIFDLSVEIEGAYAVSFHSEETCLTTIDGVLIWAPVVGSTMCDFVYAPNVTGSADWVISREPSIVGEDFGGYPVSLFSCVWCNTDILNPDGTTYLAASEPIPVYE